MKKPQIKRPAKKSAGKAVKQSAPKKTIYKSTVKSNTKKRNTKAPAKKKAPAKPPIRVTFLGGLNEIGKNMTVFECEGDMIILDCGMAFPDGDMLGVDMVIPDYTFIEQNRDKIRGVIITHGHEDHIGGIPYLLSKVNVPIYGTPLTIGLIENKLREHSLSAPAELIKKNAGDHVKLGCFDVELIHVNHSIPDSVGVAIHSPAGTIVHTGDFKIDYTPMAGGMIDLSRFAQLGDQGVLALMADSTNASRAGYTPTEQKVADSFDSLFAKARRSRIIIATFASNISRIQQILNCAQKYGRKVAFSGRSMINYMNVARELGYVKVPDNLIIDIDQLKEYPPEKVVLATTGSQGEPMSALSRMAYSDHRKVEVGAGDFIIISANPIPGNERTVGNVVDELLKRGCEVVYESMYEVHVSGHACQEELKLIHSLVKPKYFIPVHGEQKHLRKHVELAMSVGMSRKDIYVGDIGKMVELSENGMKEVDTVTAGKVFVDGLGVGDVGSIVLRDRKHLGQDGLIIIVASLDVYDGHVISGPDIVSRGFVYVRESGDLMDDIKDLALEILEDCSHRNIHEWGVIKNRVKDDVAKLIVKQTGRSPMILPILMEV
ncbi:MAG: ribonuclease J [Ruminococcus sp.]|nr:ribonuclease J [Ruminococcus sp.]